MYTVGEILKRLREDNGLTIQQVMADSGIDNTQLSRIENGKRLPTTEQVLSLANVYGVEPKLLLIQRESDKIVENIRYVEDAQQILQVAEDKMNYGTHYLDLFNTCILDKPIAIESRRYIGSKAKLCQWIMDCIWQNTENVNSFCDIFAGTGIVSKYAIERYKRVIVNDFLFSNNVIYKAFFGEGYWDQFKIIDIINLYNRVNPNELDDNYFSVNFGGKYYDYDVSKKIGWIRQDIELRRNSLTEKEYNILLATLIYNIDRLANTVGHFEAYIKKPIKPTALRLRPIDVHSYANAQIYREDANLLAYKVACDLVYIDPPYNSRQYCRFYHLYETLVKWDMPRLSGTALKPPPENMSKYCTFKAASAFADLVYNINARYIAVSYNNTYNSKSHSSENKIRLEQIQYILENCGETKVFEHAHQFFNAGKTDFTDHKEFLFITKVDNERRNKTLSSVLCGRQV